MGHIRRNEWDFYAPIYLKKMEKKGYENRDRILPALLSLCEDNLRGQKVLDLGCGFGFLSFVLEKRGADVVGIDNSRVLLGEAKRQGKHLRSNVQFVLADASTLPFSSAAHFDLIVCNMALQDIKDAGRTIWEAGRVGRPGARGLFSIRHPWTDGWRGNYTKLQELRFPLQKEWRDKARIQIYPPRYHRPLSYYVNTFLESGFKITECEEVTDQEYPTSTPLALILATELSKC